MRNVFVNNCIKVTKNSELSLITDEQSSFTSYYENEYVIVMSFTYGQ